MHYLRAAANNHICLKTLIRISWKYWFQNINTNILGVFVRKYEYEYLGNICLKLNYSERWPRRLKRLERRGQRRSRSFVSPSRVFFLFACIWFGFFILFLHLQPHHLLYSSNSRAWAKAIQVISFFLDLFLFFLPRVFFSFVFLFSIFVFFFLLFFCPYLQHYPLFLPQCFSFSFCFFQFICICDIIICSNSRARAKGDPGLKFEITDDIWGK